MQNNNTIFNLLLKAGKTLIAAGALAAALSQSAGAQILVPFTLINDASETRHVTLTEDGSHYQSLITGRYQGVLGSQTVNIWCVDLTHSIYFGGGYTAEAEYHITDAGGSLIGGYYHGGLSSALTNGDYALVSATEAAHRAGSSAYLTDHFLNSDASTFAGGASGSADLLDNLVALQIAQWDIIQDGADGLNAGSLKGDSQSQTLYAGLVSYYENLAQSHDTYASNAALWIQGPHSETGNHQQNFTATTAHLGTTSVPEPSSIGLCAGLILFGTGLSLRYSRRRK